MKVETASFFHRYQGVNLLAVCQRDTSTEHRRIRKVWIYPDGWSMDSVFAKQLLSYLRDIDTKEVMECDARLNWLVTEFLYDSDARQVHFVFSVEQTPIGLVVVVVFGEAPELEGISLESSE